MGQSLKISNKIFSLRGIIQISNIDGDIVYEARGEYLFFINYTCHLFMADKEVATITRQIFSWSSTWLIGGELGEFKIRKKFWSWVRKYQVIGGPFDSAELIGDIWGLKFKITHKSEDIARAQGKILTLRDTHYIDVLKDDPQISLLTAIAMVLLHMNKKHEQDS